MTKKGCKMSWKEKLAMGWFGLLAVALVAILVWATIDNPWAIARIIVISAVSVWTVAAGWILQDWCDKRGKG